MVELPEAETLRRDLDGDVAGRTVAGVEIRTVAAIRTPRTAESFRSRLVGRRIGPVRRRGAVLLAPLVEPVSSPGGRDAILVIDVCGGWLRLLRPAEAKSLHPVAGAADVVISFDSGAVLAFCMWTSGSLCVTPADRVDSLPVFDRIGFDPIEVPVSWTVLAQALLRRPGPIRSLLAEGSVMAGIGEFYADEILFSAGIRHDRDASRLSPQEIRRLYRAVIEVLHDAIRRRGSALDFVDLHGRPGQYTPAVYGRDGQISPGGRARVQKAKVEGGYTYFCETQV